MIYWNDTGTVAGIRLFLIVGSMILGGIAAIATIVAFFGSTWWLFDYVANYRWYLFWILVIASVIYALTAQGWMLIVLIAAAAVNAALIVPMWFGSQPESTGEDSLRIVQVDATGGFDERDEAFDWFKESNADILIIAGGSSVITADVVSEETGWVVLLEPEIENTAGLVILGKQQWDVAVTPTGIGDDTVVRISAGEAGGAFDVITSWGPLASSSQKAEQLSARLETIKTLTESATHPVVVVGNIGATIWTSGIRDLLSTTALRDAAKGFGYLSTSNASGVPIIGGWMGLPLDLVLMTDDATPIELETGPDIGAGHLPVNVLVGPVG